MLKNMADFEEKAERAAAESKALKEKTDKINKMIKDAEALEKDKPKEALTAYNKVLEQDKYNQKIISKIAALQEKTMQGNLFAEEPDGVPKVKETVPIGNTQQTEQPAQSIIEIKPATENNITAAKTGSAMDMFEQAVKVNETIVAEQKPEPAPTDVNPAIAGMSPEMLAQFRQFMAFQQQQGNNNQ